MFNDYHSRKHAKRALPQDTAPPSATSLKKGSVKETMRVVREYCQRKHLNYFRFN